MIVAAIVLLWASASLAALLAGCTLDDAVMYGDPARLALGLLLAACSGCSVGLFAFLARSVGDE